MSKKLVLIDGHSILNRAFYGVPDLTTIKGLHTNAVYGFLNIMFKILEEEEPEFLAVAFDVHAPTFRHELFEGYKGTRKPMPEELREQVPLIKQVLTSMNIVIVEQAGIEADDILGTLAKKAQVDGIKVSLVSGDRDLLQIATDIIKIRIPKTKGGKTEIVDYYAKDVVEHYQVTPEQFIDLKALMGDTADNIPGVPKIGEKTATSLMVEYGSIDNIYEHVNEITKKSIKESLVENRELATLSRVLAEIKIDCDVSLNYEQAKAENYYTKEAYTLFKELEFKNLLNRFELKEQQTSDVDTRECFHSETNIKKMISNIDKAKKEAEVGMLLIQKGTELEGIALALSEKEIYFYYCGEPQKENEQLSLFDEPEKTSNLEEIIRLKEAIKQLSEVTKIYTFDIKKQYEFLSHQTTEKYFDILIGAYLMNPLKSDYSFEDIASEYLEQSVPSYQESFGKEEIAVVYQNDPEKVKNYFCFGAYISLTAGRILEEKQKELGMQPLMNELEMPLSLVLYFMEKEGIAVEIEELQKYSILLEEKIIELEKNIYTQAGVEFNINSPKQLGEVLFETLNIPSGKKTKTGYSTAADVLEKLAPDYPIINDILEYRTIAKLKSTYADGLISFIGKDHRIHSNFNQTITATGRISSTEPNLQNIPMRMELGRRIRKAFVPREGYLFLDADYSQIELRVLAHMSKDEQLIEAYKMDQDIHRITASKVFHTPFEEVTDLQRRNAKAVNFGIVYGISSFGLSQDLSISRNEASTYIKQYFETYPKVKIFLDKLVVDAKQEGYVTTMFGRRRPIPELASSNFMQRSFGERIAMNSPIQGTAADIIKIAMLKVWKELNNRNLKSKLVLQVHDELLVETWKEEEEEVKNIIIDNMRYAADLAVLLEVDLHAGMDWYEAK